LAATLGVLVTAAFLFAAGPTLVHASGLGPVSTGTGSSGSTGVTSDPNDYACSGSVRAGAAEPGVPGHQVFYEFECDGQITGYQLQTEPHQVQYFDQAPTVVNASGSVVNSDQFSCSGTVPGIQINCVGSTAAADETISGEFALTSRVCSEPRIDPLLTVTFATYASSTITQYISGPYDLGRPQGCPADAYGGDTRLGDTPPKVVLTPRGKHGVPISNKKK
jgi:hypothetical protein